MSYIIQCGKYYWTLDNNWGLDRHRARVFDKKVPDWALPFAPDEYDHRDPVNKAKLVEISDE